MKTEIIQNIKIIALALVLVFGISYVSAQSGVWNDPECGPTGCNTATPLNVSYTGQIKQGSLHIKGLFSPTASATNGLIVENGKVGIGTVEPANKLDVVGKITATEDICIIIDGEEICLSQMGGTNSVGLLCPATPNHTSGVAETPGWQRMDIPSGCMSNQGCVIIQEIYDSNGLKKKKKYEYTQDPTTHKWWSSLRASGTLFTNGDSNYSLIVPVLASKEYECKKSWPGNVTTCGYPDGTKFIRFNDDGSNSAAEKSPTQWSVQDTWNARGQSIYVCTYPDEEPGE